MGSAAEIIIDHITHIRQIFMLAKANLIKTYQGSTLGWAWVILRPSILIGVYYFAFAVGLRVGRAHNGYPYFLWLIAGLCPWFYVRSTFSGGAGSIRAQSYLVTRIRYPVSTLPTVICLSEMFSHLVLVAVILAVFLAYGFMPDLYWLQIPFYALLMFMFMNAWSLFSATISVLSKDFLHLVRSVTMALFWMSGIFYDINTIESTLARRILRLNPVTTIVSGYRSALINKTWFWETHNLLLLRNFCAAYVIMVVLAFLTYRKLGKELSDVL